MKAIILCAGLGERLLPHTRLIPKPLFPINGTPLLDVTICRLIGAGCESIMINTHHLNNQIESFVQEKSYPIAVQTRFEECILDTGGAIKNLREFWGAEPVMVINGDILTDINISEVYLFHRSHRHPVTIVLQDFPQINTVLVDSNQNVMDFVSGASFEEHQKTKHDCTGIPYKRLTFTGIHVISPEVHEFLPAANAFSIIDFYRTLIKEGRTVKAFIPKKAYWKDIGTPAQYKSAVLDELMPKAFRMAFSCEPSGFFATDHLAGDGSDRQWYRIQDQTHSLIVADHGINTSSDPCCEFNSYVLIGRHLYDKGIAVPRIYLDDFFSGLAIIEDVGDSHLQSLVLNAGEDEVLILYKMAIRLILDISVKGCIGFDPSWTYQTPVYDKKMILEKEARYFTEAYLKKYSGVETDFDELRDEFDLIAQRALNGGVTGLMHRDFQSRNIMVKDGRLYAIDFQGARFGPIQYDLASLLIDPYVNLSCKLQDELLEFCIQELSRVVSFDRMEFLNSYQYCRITRNLQILGAFGFLTLVKKKPHFKAYIPVAVKMLHQSLSKLPLKEFPELKNIVETHDPASLQTIRNPDYLRSDQFKKDCL